MEENALEVARGISDVGMMAVTAGFFLVLAAALMVACFRWFKGMIDDMLKRNANMISDLLEETRNQNGLLTDISEGLRPGTTLMIKHTTGAFFDLAVEKVCRIINKVREENHIIDREATQKKIRTLIQNLHDDRDSKFDCYVYRGRKLTTYTSKEWVEWVAQAVENEVYNESQNPDRMLTNITAVYDRIKIDMYRRMNEL